MQVFPGLAAPSETAKNNYYSSNLSKTSAGRSANTIRVSQKVDHFVELKDMEAEPGVPRVPSRGNAIDIYSPLSERNQQPPQIVRPVDPYRQPRQGGGYTHYSEDWE